MALCWVSLGTIPELFFGEPEIFDPVLDEILVNGELRNAVYTRKQ